MYLNNYKSLKYFNLFPLLQNYCHFICRTVYMMDVEKEKENCLTGTQGWGILVYILFAGSTCLGFYLVEIMLTTKTTNYHRHRLFTWPLFVWLWPSFFSRLLWRFVFNWCLNSQIDTQVDDLASTLEAGRDCKSIV